MVVYFSVIYLIFYVSNFEFVNDINMYVINIIFVFVDVVICVCLVWFLYFVYFLIYGLVYIGFSVVVYGVLGIVIYNVLDYS